MIYIPALFKMISNDDPQQRNLVTKAHLVNYLKRNSYGNVNMDGHRIVNSSDPIDDLDAITKKYLERSAILKSHEIDMELARLINIAPPRDVQDAVNKNYADENYLNKSGTSIDLENKSLINIAESDNANSAVTRRLLENRATYLTNLITELNETNLKLGSDGEFNSNNKSIRNLAPPLAADYATNKRYVDLFINDAITKIEELEAKCLLKYVNKFNANNTIIANSSTFSKRYGCRETNSMLIAVQDLKVMEHLITLTTENNKFKSTNRKYRRS